MERMKNKHPFDEQTAARRASEPKRRGTQETSPLPRLNQTIGNQAVQKLLRSGVIQAKLDVSSPDDILEREAEQRAEEVMRMPGPESHRQSDATAADDPGGVLPAGEEVLRPGGEDGETGLEALRSGGQPLPGRIRSFFEPRFGRDFEGVRVHSNATAADLARRIQARAFTVGRDVVFGEGHYRPDTSEGKGLLAHELAHVAQQGAAGTLVQRQEIPAELLTSVNLATLTDRELEDRYDLIAQTLSQFNYSSTETAELEAEAGRIGIELARRTALTEGRTFDPTRIEAMRQFFIANAGAAAPLSCIDTLNRGVRTVLGDPGQAVRGEVQTTMAQLRTSGRAGPSHVIEYEDAAGRMTTGTTEPVAARESIWDALLQMAGGDVGWSVFGMSLVDGYHSVTLTLDNNDPAHPRVYWSDQWSSRGGWQEFNRAGLDAEVLQLTRNFRTRFNTEHGGASWPRTRTTLWRLQP